jgi:hypothetical protein
MHPEICKSLYDSEVQKVLKNPELIVNRGWLILRYEYPTLVFTMRHRKSCRVRVFSLNFEGWNDRPPSLTLLTCDADEELPHSQWPKNPPGRTYWHPGGWTSPSGIFLPSKPFMCMIGIREYHEHQQHVADAWENYKNQSSYELPQLLIQISEVFQKSDV